MLKITSNICGIGICGSRDFRKNFIDIVKNIMRYISTRGQAPALNFEEVLLAGLAEDGGLYVPESYPQFSPAEIAAMGKLSYTELAYRIIAPFIGESIPENILKQLIEDTYATFSHKAIAPLKSLDTQEWLLELFHGPTLAFKDFALQLLGRILDYVLSKRGERVTIVGATSGDTGSAAIEGCRSCNNIDIFILHPHNRVSPVQRRQMTTILADNIHNIAIEGNFDDCQEMVKAMFGAQDFLQGKSRLVAVNSINWARIMAQIVYYFYASVQLGSPAKALAFSVPTGNFGDIFAGYVAYRMGLPVQQLIVATNQNDILHRFFSENNYSKKTLEVTLSPSMDIQVSSNFERLLFELYDRDAAAIRALMDGFKTTGTLTVEKNRLDKARTLFSSCRVDDALTTKTIKTVYGETGELLDPHSAIGVYAARNYQAQHQQTTVVTLATAHPAKFAAAIEQAGLTPPSLPAHLQDLFEREERFVVLPNELTAVQEHIIGHMS